MTMEQVAIVVGIITGVVAFAGGLVSVSIKLGVVLRRLDDFERRHGELAKETRDRHAATEHRTNGLERWQAAVDAKLAGIHDALVEIRTLIQERRQ